MLLQLQILLLLLLLRWTNPICSKQCNVCFLLKFCFFFCFYFLQLLLFFKSFHFSRVCFCYVVRRVVELVLQSCNSTSPGIIFFRKFHQEVPNTSNFLNVLFFCILNLLLAAAYLTKESKASFFRFSFWQLLFRHVRKRRKAASREANGFYAEYVNTKDYTWIQMGSSG